MLKIHRNHVKKMLHLSAWSKLIKWL